MIIPSIVRKALSLLLANARRAILNKLVPFILFIIRQLTIKRSKDREIYGQTIYDLRLRLL